MKHAIGRCLVLTSLAAIFPAIAVPQAQAFHRNCCCRVCRNPCEQCCCHAPQTPCRATACQQRDVTSTEYRTEAVNETIPATVYENVMVDEGGYQTVWVPKMTTRAVAKTVYQSRTAYRSVPYQVTRRVNDCSPAATSSSYASPAAPIVSQIPLAAPASPLARNSTGPVPDPKFASASPTPITPRNAPHGDVGSSATSVASRTTSTGPSLFSPAPSAAQVWRTPRGTTIR